MVFRTASSLLATLALVLVFSGCTMQGGTTASPSATAIQQSYQDADQRFTDNVGGVSDTTKSVEVPLGSTKLSVKAYYTCGGNCRFTLKDPTLMAKQDDNISGGKTIHNDAWYSATNPTPGTWTLTISIQGGSQYAFGFYIEP